MGKRGFQPGNPGGPGGARPGAGRPSNAIRGYCQGIVERKKLVERLSEIAEGADIPQPISNGEVIPIPAPVAEQRKAISDLIDRAYGKPEQSVVANVTTEGSRPDAAQVIASIQAIEAALRSIEGRSNMDEGK